MNKIRMRIFMNSIILTIILSLLTGCLGGVSNMESSVNEQIKVAVYPTGRSSETYYFILNTDGELTAEKGARGGNDIAKSPFIKECEVSEKKQLSPSDLSKIFALVNKVYNGDFSISDVIVKDGWDIQILYKNKLIKQNYFVDIPAEVKELVDEFIYISPIKVDLHGWS